MVYLQIKLFTIGPTYYRLIEISIIIGKISKNKQDTSEIKQELSMIL